jgi:formylglycine-generating enzyme
MRARGPALIAPLAAACASVGLGACQVIGGFGDITLASSGDAAVTARRDARSSVDSGADAGRDGGQDRDATGPRSCRTGMTNQCGARKESCCTTALVAGGAYDRSYDPDGPDGGTMVGRDGAAVDAANPATISNFELDKYLVTVGRFRQFTIAWNAGAGYLPPAGAGKHAYLSSGQGLANSGTLGTFEPGWQSADNAKIEPTTTNLISCTDETWTASPAAQEELPINCVNWYEAYAFCIWDGGFLPSEAEWEYAAAGGSQQRAYPWGATPPAASDSYAVYDCDYGACTTGVSSLAPVGTAALGAGRWGQLDLAGEVWEWTLDWYAAYVDPCTDCANLLSTGHRVFRGGYFYSGTQALNPAYRNLNTPTTREDYLGVRCARSP